MNKVLACVDGGIYTSAVCDYAAWCAVRLAAPLEFLHVIDRHPERALVSDLSGSIGLGAQESLLDELARLDETRAKVAQDHGRQVMEAAKGRARAAGVAQIHAQQRHGALVETLQEMEHEIRLAVIGQHPMPGEVPRLHLDQDVERVVRSLKRPVLVCVKAFTAPRRFLIAFDGSATGRRMVDMVAGSPLLRDLPCHLVMAADDNPSTQEHRHWAQATLSSAGFGVETTVRAGEPESVLRAAIADHDADLLVMGAYGHSRIRELIVGSTTTALLRTSPVPVLILR